MTTHRPHHPRPASARVHDRRRIIAAVAAVAVVAAGCIPYDLTGTLGADHVYVDSAGAWRVFGTDEIIWTGPVPGEPGASGRYSAPGNYDGEGRWEPAIVDVTTGVWTTAGARGTFTFPAPSDPSPGPYAETGDVVAVPGDYDGDGDTEPAYFVEDTATWHIEGQAPFTFGHPTTGPDTLVIRGATVHDVATPADYDGDGDTDPAVYHPHNGDVDVLGEAAPRRTNLPWSLPAAADYHGSHAADASALGLLWQGWAVEGEPLILQQRGSNWGEWWQGVAGVPAPADYDGDGDTERALVAFDGSQHLVVDGTVLGTFARTHSVATPPSVAANIFDVSKWGNECAHAIRFECPGEDAYFVTTSTTQWIPARDDWPWPDAIHTPVGGIPLRGDYDGDGTAEPAAYLEATGEWATNGTRGTFSYPAPPDIDTDPTTSVYPVPADYDGDGDWDPAFYRDADATWHIEGAAPIHHGRPTTTTPTFGTGTPIHDLPVPGDYDGDGDWDLATYRLDTGEHHIAGHTPTTTAPWPIGEPTVADMDGDGHDDLAIWDDADGTGVLHTVEGLRYFRHPLEALRGAPAPGDWDGDGDREIAILGELSGPGRNLYLPSVNRQANAGLVESDYVHPTTGQLVVNRPAFGRWETYANHAYVDSYVAACVAPTTPPPTCP